MVQRAVFDAKTRMFLRSDRRALAEMQRTERLPADALRELSDARSAQIAVHAFRTTKHYRAAFTAAGLGEGDVAKPENFTELPILTKDQVQEAGPALASSDAPDRDRLASRTGGSTGRPLEVFNDRRAPVAALWWRIYSWWGISPADSVAFIYRQARHGRQKFVYDAQWWPTRHVLLDARGTTRASMQEFVRRVESVRPRLLVGYVEGVREFAEYALAEQVELPTLSAVSVTASMLHDGQRQLIQRGLHAPVFDTYRSAEVPWIAAECAAQDGLHVLSDRRRVDVVSEGRGADPGAVGDVLVTDFDNRAFPLIRYAIGDRTRWVDGACPCGRSLPRIDALEGRVADVLRTPSGRIVSGGYGGLFNAWPGSVRQFQLYQAADHAVTVRFVPGADRGVAEDAAARVVDVVADFLDREVPVTSVEVDQIASSSGKARLVVSDVADNGST